jgi:hypothetical protein
MLAQLVAWDAAGDGRAVFLDCYAEMTRAVGQAIDDDRFEEPEWVSRLLERFAEHYFASIDGVASDPGTLAWRAAVGTTPRRQLLMVRALTSTTTLCSPG